MYQYRPQNEDELELREGDRVDVMQQCDDGWFVGRWAWGTCGGQAGRTRTSGCWREGLGAGWKRVPQGRHRESWLTQHIHLLAWLIPRSQHFCCCLQTSKRDEAQVTD